MPKSDDCSSNIHEFCNPCDCPCHGMSLDPAEVRAIYRIIQHEWINRDDQEAMDVTDKISSFIKEHGIHPS